jgi:3-isopropylmalate/(R)-2-methylmalate dehydratase large subunit
LTTEDVALRFSPRILFLSQSAQQVDAVFRGEPVTLEQAMPLRDDVSTDEITPLPILTHYDEQLGLYPYTGFKAGERLPIGPGIIEKTRIAAYGPRCPDRAARVFCFLQGMQ